MDRWAHSTLQGEGWKLEVGAGSFRTVNATLTIDMAPGGAWVMYLGRDGLRSLSRLLTLLWAEDPTVLRAAVCVWAAALPYTVAPWPFAQPRAT